MPPHPKILLLQQALVDKVFEKKTHETIEHAINEENKRVDALDRMIHLLRVLMSRALMVRQPTLIDPHLHELECGALTTERAVEFVESCLPNCPIVYCGAVDCSIQEELETRYLQDTSQKKFVVACCPRHRLILTWLFSWKITTTVYLRTSKGIVSFTQVVHESNQDGS